jgi:hypothetical protein
MRVVVPPDQPLPVRRFRGARRHRHDDSGDGDGETQSEWAQSLEHSLASPIVTFGARSRVTHGRYPWATLSETIPDTAGLRGLVQVHAIAGASGWPGHQAICGR